MAIFILNLGQCGLYSFVFATCNEKYYGIFED